jgi:hypothetical protein
MEKELSKPSLTDLEKEMLKYPQAECSVIHRFGPGLYIRELHMPSNIYAIGHYQKFDHMNIFLKGRITMIEGDKKVELKAPMIFVAPPGRKIGYVKEDVVWLNIYPTDEKNIEILENTYLDKSRVWESSNKLNQMNRGQKHIDQEDYIKLLSEFDIEESVVKSQCENKDDQIDMPPGSYKFLIAKSNIHKKGVFATATINIGEEIGPARIGDKRTPIGRYVNHSKSPNAKMVAIGKDIYLVATQKIEGCRGGFNGDEITTNYRNNLKLIGVKKCQQ